MHLVVAGKTSASPARCFSHKYLSLHLQAKVQHFRSGLPLP